MTRSVVARARRRAASVSRRYGLPVACFSVLSLLVFSPLLGRGYVLSLDMIFAPDASHVDYLLSVKGPLYYGRLPFVLLLDGLGLLLEDWLIQKLVLLSLPVLCGSSAYAACTSRSRVGRLFAGTLYAVNPFVYVRLLAGHWYFLLGYAFLPLAIVAFYRHLHPDSDGGLPRAVWWATVVSVFDPHATVLLAVAGVCVAAGLFVGRTAPGVRHTRAVVRRFGTYVVCCAAVNAYWLLPAVVGSPDTRLATIDAADLVAFGPTATLASNVPLSVAMLYGFWRPGYLTTVAVLTPWVTYALFGVLLFLVVDGAVRHRTDALVPGLALFSLVGFTLALGTSTPVSEPVFESLVETLPILRGMRDSQKFAGLLAVAYALLGGLGVDHGWRAFSERTSALSDVEVTRPTSVGFGRTRLVTGLFVLLVLSVPLAYAAPMVGGLAGQLESTDYPREWNDADDYLSERSGQFRVLVLPWHQYVAFSWTSRTIANPAELFFGPSTIAGHNVEVAGIESRASDPTRRRAADAIDAFDRGRLRPGELGERLAPLGVRFVLLLHEADYERYQTLHRSETFDPVFRTERLTVLENRAFTEAPAASWPRAGPPSPVHSLGAGGLLSVLTSVLLVRRNR